ncbi:TPA: hypothetical protein ACH3X1_000113 [Trebouxia sp. C0004]
MTVGCFGGWHRRLSIILARHRFSSSQFQCHSSPAAAGYIYHVYRPQLWFWSSIVLVLTLLLAASQVFAIALDTYFQLIIMILILDVTTFACFHPFTNSLLQGMQVLGLLTVVSTETGCLYFTDPSKVASTQGLEPVGALLVILIVNFVVLDRSCWRQSNQACSESIDVDTERVIQDQRQLQQGCKQGSSQPGLLWQWWDSSREFWSAAISHRKSSPVWHIFR